MATALSGRRLPGDAVRDEKLYAIVNDAAGNGRAGSLAAPVIASLQRSGIVGEIVHTRGPGDATRLAREALAKGHRRFLAVGGDGTTFEVVNGLFPDAVGRDVELGMLPVGTGNSFLRDFGITSAEDAVNALSRGETKTCDVARAVHREGVVHYINLLSVGFSARAGALTNDRFKPLGAAGYVLAVLSCLARLEYDASPIALDDSAPDTRPSALLSFSNSRYTGGTMMMAPTADVADGQIDVIRVGKLGRVRFLNAFPRIFAGKHVGMRDIEATRAKTVRFERAHTQAVMVDGEIMQLCLERIEMLPGALKVIA